MPNWSETSGNIRYMMTPVGCRCRTRDFHMKATPESSQFPGNPFKAFERASRIHLGRFRSFAPYLAVHASWQAAWPAAIFSRPSSYCFPYLEPYSDGYGRPL